MALSQFPEQPNPMSAQPLPDRPGAMAAQPIRRRGSVTAGRPLPPRPGEAAQPVAAPQPVAAQQPVAAYQAAVPQVAAAVPVAPYIEARRPSRPDPRPMRLAIGAGAVAAVSVFAVGLVKPDFSANADQPVTTDAESAGAAADDGSPAQGRRRVRHVTEYVFLQPGEKAPRGATVISADELTGEPTRNAPAQAARPNTTTPRSNPEPARQPAAEPAPQADRQPPPRQDPTPVRTRQSG